MRQLSAENIRLGLASSGVRLDERQVGHEVERADQWHRCPPGGDRSAGTCCESMVLQYRIHASNARMATRALDSSVPEAWRRTVVAEGVRDPVGPRDELVRQLFGHLN